MVFVMVGWANEQTESFNVPHDPKEDFFKVKILSFLKRRLEGKKNENFEKKKFDLKL